MNRYEIRDIREAQEFLPQEFLLQGLLWQCVVSPGKNSIQEPLEWALEIVSRGDPLPPIGFLADLGHLCLGMDWETRQFRDSRSLAGLPINQIRTYEDHVLGKLYADWTFTRASEAIRGYQGRDRARGLAFLVEQFRQRCGFSGVDLAPGVIKQMLKIAPEKLLADAWESQKINQKTQQFIADLYDGLIHTCRRMAEALGPEDLFELEHRTALNEFGHRLALKQVLRVVSSLENELSITRMTPQNRQRDTATNILEEDTYPVGGFTSLSNRGSIESLLQSQLAFMDPDRNPEPDLFDIKFVRDELLYYSRDENQFFRRRRSFFFLLEPDLISTRFKDPQLSFQRGIYLLALIVAVIRNLEQYLTNDALQFQIIFVGAENENQLGTERALLDTLLRDQIQHGTVGIHQLPMDLALKQCERASLRSLCSCLQIAQQIQPRTAENTLMTWFEINGARPSIGDELFPLAPVNGDEEPNAWVKALEEIIRRWL